MSLDPIDLENRALVAYKRRTGPQQVDGAACTTLNGKTFVAVRQFGQAIAVYALHANGRLRYLATWPEAIW